MRALFLALCALLTTAPAHAQSWGCGGLPPRTLVEASATRLILQMEIATTTTKACLGVASRVKVGSDTKYRVEWVPCPGASAWRRGGDSSTMAKAMKAAAKPPACGAAT